MSWTLPRLGRCNCHMQCQVQAHQQQHRHVARTACKHTRVATIFCDCRQITSEAQHHCEFATCMIYEHYDNNLTLVKLPKFAKQSGGAAAVCYVCPKALAELTRCTCGVVTCCSTTLASRCSSGKCGSCLLMTARMLAEVLVAAKDFAV